MSGDGTKATGGASEKPEVVTKQTGDRILALLLRDDNYLV